MYDKILIPVEGEEHEDEMLRHAIEHAQNHDAELHTVHVLKGKIGEKRANSETSHPDGPHADEKKADDTLLDVETRVPDDIKLTRSKLGGEPSDSIIEYADEHEIDLIVMGTHGRGGVRRLLIGSVAEEVVRHANCPVLTVPLKD